MIAIYKCPLFKSNYPSWNKPLLSKIIDNIAVKGLIRTNYKTPYLTLLKNILKILLYLNIFVLISL